MTKSNFSSNSTTNFTSVTQNLARNIHKQRTLVQKSLRTVDLIKRTSNENQIRDRSSKSQKLHCNWQAICARFACRSGCVVHGGATFWWKMLSTWSNRSFQTNFKFAVIINYVARRCSAPLARCEFSALSSNFSLCAVPVATLCVFAMILVPCTFKRLLDPSSSFGGISAKFWVTDVKLVVEFEKRLFLSFDPLTASFRPFSGVRSFFRDQKYENWRHVMLTVDLFFIRCNFHVDSETRLCFFIRPSNG
jgi:hypothetical protein